MSVFAANSDAAYLCDTPALATVRALISAQAAQTWVYDQLVAIWMHSSSKDESSALMLSDVAGALLDDFAPYTLAELMVFFAKYAAGRYGNAFGFSVRDIGIGFREWKKERNAALARLEPERAAKARAAEFDAARKNAVTKEAYEAMKAIPVTLEVPDAELRTKIATALHAEVNGDIVKGNCPKGPLFCRIIQLDREKKLRCI